MAAEMPSGRKKRAGKAAKVAKNDDDDEFVAVPLPVLPAGEGRVADAVVAAAGPAVDDPPLPPLPVAKVAAAGGAKEVPKPAAAPTGECKFFAAGSCKKGDACGFRHVPPVAAPVDGVKVDKVESAVVVKDRRERVKLDVHLEEEEFTRLVSAFPLFWIDNGPLTRVSAHAYDRCERSLVSRYLSRDTGRCTLEVQGRVRGTDVPTRDVCRLGLFDEDDDGVCPPDCEHFAKLANGDYNQVVALDVPLTPAVCRAYLDAPGVTQVVLAIHLHAAVESRLGSQVAVWTAFSRRAHPFAIAGSVGFNVLNCVGRAQWIEPDHAWLSMQLPVGGVKPEVVVQMGTFTILRLTRVRDTVVEPIVVPSLWPLTKRGAPAVYAQVGVVGRGGTQVVRVSEQLVLLKDDDGWFATTAEDVRAAHDLAVGRPVDAHLRRKLESTLAREGGDSDVSRLVGVVLDLELHDSKVSQDAWDRPAPSSWMSWVPFAQFLQIASRRTAADTVTRRAKGEYVVRPSVWLLLAALVMLAIALSPWPCWNYDSVFEVSLLWRTFTVGSGTADAILSVSVPWIALSRVVTQYSWCFGGFDLAARAPLVVVAILSLAKLAYARDGVSAVREAYIDDRFSTIDYDGPLPVGFGLPGYVADRELKPLGEGCTITIKEPEKWTNVEEPADMCFAVGIVFAGYWPSVSLPCQENLIVAGRNRQLAAMPAVNESYFSLWAERYHARFEAVSDIQPQDFDAWNARFPRGRQANHVAAREALRECRLSYYEIILRSVFVKVEKILRIGKGAFDPRVITGAADAFNVIWGNWFYTARKAIKEAYEQLGENVLFASGKTSRELGEWFETSLETSGRAICGDDQLVITRGVFAEGDGVKHDAHMNEQFFELKWRRYEHFFRHIPRSVLRHAKEAGRMTVARSRAYGVKWTHKYRVRSGDPDTSDGNSVCTDFVASTIQDLVEEGLDEGFTLVEIQKQVVEAVLQFGYEVELKLTRDPTAATFLSGAFMPVDGVMYWYPLPGRQLAKLGWSLRNVGTDVAWRDFAGVLNSYRDFSFVPFLRVYVDVVSQLVPEEHRLAPPSKRWLVGPGITPQAPSDDTWDWFTRRYSLTRCDEEELQTALRAVTTLPFCLDSPAVRVMLEVDMA